MSLSCTSVHLAASVRLRDSAAGAAGGCRSCTGCDGPSDRSPNAARCLTPHNPCTCCVSACADKYCFLHTACIHTACIHSACIHSCCQMLVPPHYALCLVHTTHCALSTLRTGVPRPHCQLQVVINRWGIGCSEHHSRHVQACRLRAGVWMGPVLRLCGIDDHSVRRNQYEPADNHRGNSMQHSVLLSTVPAAVNTS